MNDLIDSNGFWGKVAHYEKTYQMIGIFCGYVKHHRAKKLISAN